MGYNDLGDFHYARGDLQQAFKCYVRTRDYCTTSKHIIAMCLNVILVSIELGHFVHVSNYVSKADQTPDVQDAVVIAKLKCAAGLAHLESKKYKLAARKVLRAMVYNIWWLFIVVIFVLNGRTVLQRFVNERLTSYFFLELSLLIY
jgi:hypothetical protein